MKLNLGSNILHHLRHRHTLPHPRPNINHPPHPQTSTPTPTPQVDYLLSGIFSRACKALGGTSDKVKTHRTSLLGTLFSTLLL
jgi:hypothetical protein